MDSDAAFRLALSLSGAGFLLLLMEVWLANYACGTIGLMSVCAAIGLAFMKCSIDVAAFILLATVTLVSLGVLLMLVYLPQCPLAKALFHRYAERARREAEAASEDDDDLWPTDAIASQPPPEKMAHRHYPPEPLEEEREDTRPEA